MSIIEFVHLILPPPHTTTSAALLATIPPSCQVMGAASGLPSVFFSDLLDESKMYVIGGWPSQEAHQKGFNGSAEQGKLIEVIKGVMDIEWMEYFNLDVEKIGKERLEAQCLVGVICNWGPSINEDARRVSEHWLREQAGMDVVMGWNLKKMEKEGEDVYLVMFAGFKSLEEGKVRGEKVTRAMQDHQRGDQVRIVYMRRINVEGNGAVP